MSDFGVLPLTLSDHLITYIGRKINYNYKTIKNSKMIAYHRWSKIDYNSMNRKISEINLNNIDANKQCNDFNLKIHEIIKREIPIKTKFIRNKGIEKWIDSDILNSIHIKNKIQKRLFYERKNNINSVKTFNEFKKLRNKTNILIKYKKREYFNKEVINCGNNTTKLWKILKDIVPTKANRKTSKTCDNKSDSEFNAEKINDFFIEEPKRIVEEVYENQTNLILEENFISNEKYQIPLINDSIISKTINNFPIKKSKGSDGLSMKFIKLFKFSIILNLLSIINNSIKSSTFPTAWKIAKVFPLHKNGSKTEANNFRPISLLPIFSKVIEKHVEYSLRNFLLNNKLLSKFQFGFKSNHSTIDALIAIINNISKSLNTNQKSILITFDLKKAFDCIDQKIMIKKLSGFCDRKTTDWFESYLYNRYSFVF